MNKVLICILLLLNVTSKQHIFTQIDGDYKCVENLCNLKMTILSHRERYTYSIEKNGIYLNGTIPDNGFVMSKLTQFTLKLKNYDGIEMNGKINKDTIYIRKSDLEKYFKIENKSEYIKLIKS